VVSVVAIWVVLRSVDLGSCATVLSHANPIPLAGCLAVIATQIVLRSIRWRLLLPSPPGGGRTRVARIVPVLLVGYLGNAVLPARLGEPIRAYLVARREDLDAAEAFGSVVLERVVVRFLPYTTKSRLPQHPALVRAYLQFRLAWWLLGGQTLYIGRRP